MSYFEYMYMCPTSLSKWIRSLVFNTIFSTCNIIVVGFIHEGHRNTLYRNGVLNLYQIVVLSISNCFKQSNYLRTNNLTRVLLFLVCNNHSNLDILMTYICKMTLPISKLSVPLILTR